MSEGQDTPAAERSGSIARGPLAGPEVDTRPGYWVEILDPAGLVVRKWLTRFEAPPIGFAMRIRPAER